ncbi:MAG TPA: hypothetical protein PKW80_02075 [Bacteroidales bacterium]|nr:hypothetical protein [Bacteroidales bacterium]
MLFNIFGYYLAFQITVRGNKRHYREHIYYSSYDNTEDIIISGGEIQSENGYNNCNEEDEFYYHGKKYEIIKIKKQGSNNIFFCVKDKKKEKFLAFFKEYLIHHEDSNTPYQQNSHNFVAHIIKDAVPEHRKLLLFPKDINDRNFYYFFSIQTAILNNIFVPPKNLV